MPQLLEILVCQHPPRATALHVEEVSSREVSASDHPSLKSPPHRAERRDHAVREAPRVISERQAQELSDQRGDVWLVLQEASADAKERNIPEFVVRHSRELSGTSDSEPIRTEALVHRDGARDCLHAERQETESRSEQKSYQAEGFPKKKE